MSDTVHARPSAQRHLCHASGCPKAVPPRMFMCGSHWKRLPAHHRSAVWRYYRTGQENDKSPSLEYLVASHQAILAMAIIDARPADEVERARKNLDWLQKKEQSAAVDGGRK